MSQPTVIVGAGSSGAVLARRLSKRPEREVLLLEAGPDYLASELPRDLRGGLRNSLTRHDWGYRHEPNAFTMKSPFPRGRVVGGSSAVNTCIALRGQPEDYDEWAALGLAEWSFEQCLPAFKRLERDLDFDADYHGKHGPLPVRRHTPGELCVVQRTFMEACAELGLPACPDSNAPGKVGFGPHAMNKLEGRRISAAEAYLTSAVRARPNLHLRPSTLVRRVLFRDKRVCGVEIEDSAGELRKIETRKVILCAGAINTPGVLLRSGIGPDRELRRLQCAPIVDAPAVGRRLLDHPATGIFVLAKKRGVVDHEAALVQTVFRFASGMVEHPADMLLQPASFTLLPRRPPLFALVTQVGKPFGHGELRYPDAQPRSQPRIQSRFFEDARDRAMIRDSVRRCHALLRTRALSSIGRPMLPWSGLLTSSDALLDRVIVRMSGSGYHPCGTVPMGNEPGPDAAVDGRGRVFGVEGLFVVDASVMPTIPSSNIHLPTLMIAERMSEWL